MADLSAVRHSPTIDDEALELMLPVFVALAYIAGILTAIHSIMSVRTAQGAVAWSISLLTFPYLAVPLYWVFGRNKFQGYVRARRKDLEGIEGLSQRAYNDVAENPLAADIPRDGILGAEEVARFPVTAGNRAELLIDGDTTFDDIVAGIESAQRYILIQFYIVRDDELGRRIRDALIERARAGIRVLFLYDEIGSAKLSRAYIQTLKDECVEVHAFGTSRGQFTNRFQVNFRNHRKIVVVDGHTSWVGGHNIGDEYLGKDPKFGHWRDTHVRIEGPATLAFQVTFLEDWHWATGGLPGDLSWEADRSAGGTAAVLAIPSGPADKLETAALMYTQAINAARDRVWIASPYFVPDGGLIAALQLAALRGVDVRILVPANPDHIPVWLAGFASIDQVEEVGIDFYLYEDGFLHQKVILIDDRACAVGTANFDNRSFRLNFEITALFLDAGLAADVEQMFEADFAKSRLMERGEFARRPFWFRLAARTCHLASPIL